MTILQCASVDGMPNWTGTRGLPSVIDGSTVAVCHGCGARVWLSRVAKRDGPRDPRLLCERCHPASNVAVTHEELPS